jgi:hypothetical protein
MKGRIFLLLGILSVLFTHAQSDDNVTLDFYGFVRVDAYMDTYKGVDAGHDIFYLLPLYATPGGIEVNNQLSSNISAIASRLGVRINFPETFKAKSTGVIEFDFAGNLRNEPTMFRIRQAYSLFTWENSSLLVGQTWHPLFGGSNMPVVAGLNTGAPFSAFNRSPMIRFSLKAGNTAYTASAVSEIQYTSPLADQADFAFVLTPNHAKRNGVIPELVLNAEWSEKTLTFGAGASYKRIKPRMMISGTDSKAIADEYLASTVFMGYGRYKNEKLTFLLKGYMGENMSHLVMPGGYGVASYDVLTGKETYTSYQTYTASMSLVYGQKWQMGLFAGYGGNLGTQDKLYDAGGKAKTYGSFLNMQTMNRIAPHVSLNLPKFKLVAEYERTSANYGTGAINLDDGLYSTSKMVTNNRFIVVMTQYF